MIYITKHYVNIPGKGSRFLLLVTDDDSDDERRWSWDKTTILEMFIR